MSVKTKRLERIRRSHNNISFEDYRAVLEHYGFSLRNGGKTTHHVGTLNLSDKIFKITFVKPHGNRKFMDIRAVKKLITLLEDIDILLSELSDKNKPQEPNYHNDE